MWGFETDPHFQEKLDWAKAFVTEEVEPLDSVLRNPYDKTDAVALRIVEPLQEKVREQGLWACHLEQELGGQGYGQVKLALLNEILGRSRWAPSVFGCQAPDSGNGEILAKYGTEDQKQQYLRPLLDGRISSCYAMTEPQAGSDPLLFRSRAEQDGDEWVINGEKWFASNARYAAFYLSPVVTGEPGDHHGMSMFIIPAETPGIEIVRNVGVGTEEPGEGAHAYVRFTDVRVPADHLLGRPGEAFAIAQTRLGGGRIHHAMRTVGQLGMCLEAMTERAVSRRLRDGRLADAQLTQEAIARSWIEIEQFKLLVMRTAWLIDRHQDYAIVRKDIAAVKVALADVFRTVVQRAMQLHGSMGMSNEMPFAEMLMSAMVLGVADGPSEVHLLSLARSLLRDVEPVEGLWPSLHLPTRRDEALKRYAGQLA